MESELRQIVADRDLITADGFLEFARESSLLRYSKRDFLFRGGTWRNERQQALISQNMRGIKGLLVGHSDYYLSWQQSLILQSVGLPRVFSANADPFSSFTFPIPVGLTPETLDTPLHAVLGDQALIAQAWEQQESRLSFSGQVFANFSSKTNRAVRGGLLATISKEKNFKIQAPDYSANGRLEYLKNLRRSNFVLCPVGNSKNGKGGSHRIWETLYMGGFPIVKAGDPYLASVLAGLPVSWVRDWREVLEISFLAIEWDRLNNFSGSTHLLRLSYWCDFIKRFSI